MIFIQVYFILAAIYILVAGYFNFKGKNPEHWAGVLIAGSFFWPILLTINLIKTRGPSG